MSKIKTNLIVILLLVSRCYIYVIYKFLNFEANYAYISNTGTCNVLLASALTHLQINLCKVQYTIHYRVCIAANSAQRVPNRFRNNM